MPVLLQQVFDNFVNKNAILLLICTHLVPEKIVKFLKMSKRSFCSKNLKFIPYHERLGIRIKTFIFRSPSNAKLDNVI